MMEQLALFAMEPAAAAPGMAAGSGDGRWRLSSDVDVRRAGVSSSADYWQCVHEASGLQHSVEQIFAEQMREVAADMERRPAFYAAKPAGLSDFRWFFDGAAAVEPVAVAAPGAMVAACDGSPAQEEACALSLRFLEACAAAGFQYRGYEADGADRVYCYSRPGSPQRMFRTWLSQWDRSAQWLTDAAAIQGSVQ